jgi:hypothetical protein
MDIVLSITVLSITVLAFILGGDVINDGGETSGQTTEFRTSSKPARNGGFGPNIKGVQLGVVMKDTEFVKLAIDHFYKPGREFKGDSIQIFFRDQEGPYVDGGDVSLYSNTYKSFTDSDNIAKTLAKYRSNSLIALEFEGINWLAERLPENPELCRIKRFSLLADEFGAEKMTAKGFAQALIDNYEISRMQTVNSVWSSEDWITYEEDDYINGWKVAVLDRDSHPAGVVVETATTKESTSFN